MTVSRRAVLGGGAAFVAGGAALTGWRAGARERAADAAFPPEGTLVDVGGTVVHAITRGAGPDVVLLHGAMGTARDFTYRLMDRLADRHRVTAFDRPGAGFTDSVDPAHDRAWGRTGDAPGAQAGLLRAAARILGLVRPVVVGHSFGASTALAWALDDPGGTAALVTLAGIVVPWEGPGDPLFRVLASPPGGALLAPLAAAFAPEAVAARALDAVFAPDPVPPGYAAWVGAPLSLRRRAVRATARQVAGLKADLMALAPRYGDLALPVEVVQDDADAITDGLFQATGLMRLVPDGRLTVLPGAGHMPHHADPGAVAAAIDRARARADG